MQERPQEPIRPLMPPGNGPPNGKPNPDQDILDQLTLDSFTATPSTVTVGTSEPVTLDWHVTEPAIPRARAIRFTLESGAGSFPVGPVGSQSVQISSPMTFSLVARLGRASADLGDVSITAIPPSNLAIAGVEQTQTIQFFLFNGQGSGFAPNNTVPLVANKPMLLRTYIDGTTLPQRPIPTSVTGKVSTVRVDFPSTYPDLIPFNGPIPATPSSTIDRGNLNHTLNFVVPASYCTGRVSFTIRVFDPAHPDEASYAAIPLTVAAVFEDVPPLSVHGVLIHYTGPNFFDMPVDAQPSGFDLLQSLDYMLRTYPVGRLNFDGFEVLPWSAKLALTQNFNDLFGKLGTMRAMSGTHDLYIGLLPPEAGCGGVCGLGGGGVALFFAQNGPEGSHEIGHALGRPHSPCANGAPNADPNYPVYNNYPRGSIGEYGFDMEMRTSVLDPRQTYDFMSYCSPVWVSPWTYVKLKDAVVVAAASLTAAAALQRSSAWSQETAEFFHLSCRIHRDAPPGRVQFSSAFHLPRRPPQWLPGTPSDVTLELLSETGGLIDVVRCIEQEQHVDAPMPFADYQATFPQYSELRSLRVVRDGNILTVLEVAQEAPRVEIVDIKRIEPHEANLLSITWRGEAPKEVTPGLEYGIRYSHDGVHWRALATGLTETQYVVNLNLIPGGELCRLQVVASAGLRTTIAETEPFMVPRKPRSPYILSPQSSTEFQVGTPITLSGAAFSPDFGLTAPNEVVWYSRSIGTIGTGYQVITNAFPVGHHRITMYVPDGFGDEASASVEISVKP